MHIGIGIGITYPSQGAINVPPANLRIWDATASSYRLWDSNAADFRSYGSAAGAWTPEQLLYLAPSLQVALMRSSGLLWQDLAMTTLATAHTDPVYVARCPFTGAYFRAPSSAARPTVYSEGGGLYSLNFDGVNDEILIPTWAVSSFSVHIRQNTTGDCNFLGKVGSSSSQLRIGQGAANVLSAYNGGTNPLSSTLSASRGTANTVGFEVSGGVVSFYEGTTAKSSGTLAGVQTYDIISGPQAATTIPINGRVSALIRVESVLSTAERASLASYLGAL